ncbi:MAG: DUF1549 domain-containing protein [Candidatus Hydrogenedentes bacterium]|nr:DUF1549 domain-containing protein [Candidatus Hydrogenedentota bacterium]
MPGSLPVYGEAWGGASSLRRLAAAATVLTIAAIGTARADTIQVFPDHAQIDSAQDTQRMIVVLTRDDGVTLDVTDQAQVSFENPEVAQWTETFRLAAKADGETTATFTVGEASITAPVKVTNAGVTPPVSFRNDILPVLMRAGCNSGACHGSAQGKNGFHLSLFGFNPASDYVSLTRESRSRRMDPARPAESLMLLKPLGEVPHDGGTKIAKGDGMYETLYRWIAEGSQDDPAELPSLTGIEVLPKYAVIEGKDAKQRFVVRATYSDGTDRDVTDLAVLASSDDMTLTVTPDGVATAGNQGEVYVMARYGSFALVSQVIVIPQGLTLAWPEDAVARNYIDDEIFAKLRKLRVPPAALASDNIFIRRVYLDILGVLPTVEEVQAFLTDESPEKRAALIDQLLERPEFAEVWAMKWAEVLRVATTADQRLDAKGLHRYNDWLRQAITSNKPLDQLVRDLLTAEGGNFTQPAANFYLVETDPLMMAENVAQVFMGVQLKCAQCHNHPFERWTMDDYYSFSAWFAQVGRKGSSDPREKIVFNSGSGEVKHIMDGRAMAPKFLGGEQPDLQGRDRRAVLAEWLTAPENPWFANNIANRVWQHFFGRGIVDPPDDVRVTNPPSNPLLLEELGKRLISYNYDLRTLVRDICNSSTYQMSTQPRNPEIRDERNCAFATARRMPAEQLLDAINHVTGSTTKFANLPLGARAVEVANGNSGNYFLNVFGRPARETVCTCERRNEPTLAQTLHLINGDTVQQAINAPGGRLEKLLAEESPAPAAVQQLYMAALCREPTAEESAQLDQYVAQAPDKKQALEDVFWSVLNSKEFVFNH